MKSCPRCGFANLDTRDSCLKCRAQLAHDEALAGSRVRRRRFDLTGAGLPSGRAWRRLTGWMRPRLPDDLPHRRPSKAATLGLVPGVGQLYNRQPLKALWFLVGWVVALAVAVWSFREPLSHVTLLGFVALWLWCANDALATACRINGQAWSWRHSVGSYFAILFFVAFVWGVGLMAASPLVYFRLIGDDTFAPVIRQGDFIWLDKRCLWFGGEPRRGELIYYDPAGFTMHRGADTYLYDAQNFIERVIGLPGETVSIARVDGEVAIGVNGEPLPPDLYPLSTEYLYTPREWTVPPDHWLIFQSKTMDEGLAAMMGARTAPSLAGADFEPERRWTQSCLVHRDQMIGRVFAISHPPERRRWFPREP